MSKARLHIKIQGLVQGVFFRVQSRDKAKELNLFGWVKNLEDGGLEILAEGNKNNLESFLFWCSKGPDSARVSDIKEEWLEFQNEFDEFGIRR